MGVWGGGRVEWGCGEEREWSGGVGRMYIQGHIQCIPMYCVPQGPHSPLQCPQPQTSAGYWGNGTQLCTRCTLCAASGDRGGGEYKYRDICTLSPHTLITLISMLSIHTHLVFILFIFDSTMEGTLEHEPTHMVCVVEPGSGVEECVEVKESCKTIQSTTGYLYPRT